MHQSQLQAALLGQSALIAPQIDDGSPVRDDETEETEEFPDEDPESDPGGHGAKYPSLAAPRVVSLQMLLASGILQPGEGLMSIEYLGQRFVGDLFEDGKIKSQETDIVFASPSAWAIACKRFINPDKKSGCGWASIKYRGRKLEVYKNIWYRKRKEELERDSPEEVFYAGENMAQAKHYRQIIVKHNAIANRTITHDANTLIECVPFSVIGKIQPFLVSLSTNAAFLMDFHCHLTSAEVSGYLGGSWDVNSHNLQITHAFPCRTSKSDSKETILKTEAEIAAQMEKEGLILVGWYHSHPHIAAAPTLRDVDAQLDYQIKLKGTSDNNYSPCLGIILSPYCVETNSLESSIIAYWVIPPPEAKPNEYGRPMLMSYSVSQDANLTESIRDEMKRCVEHYRTQADFVDFGARYLNILNMEKLKTSLISKFPRDDNENAVWSLVQESLGYKVDNEASLLSIPSISKSYANTMMDLSSVFLNSSLMGLPDPMAHSTLAANNMFISSNLFKMQELLKPVKHSTPLKIPTDFLGAAEKSKSEEDFVKTEPEDRSMDLSTTRENKSGDNEQPLNLASE